MIGEGQSNMTAMCHRDGIDLKLLTQKININTVTDSSSYKSKIKHC